MPDIAWNDIAANGGLVTALVACVGAAWNHWSQKTRDEHAMRLEAELASVKSQFARQEEAFRLSQSPRVQAAIKLWKAFCEYERAVKLMCSPAAAHASIEPAVEDSEASTGGSIREAQVAEVARLQEAVCHLDAAKDEAECLVPKREFELFDALYERYNLAPIQLITSKFGPEPYATRAKGVRAAQDHIKAASDERTAVVEAMRAMIDGRVASPQCLHESGGLEGTRGDCRGSSLEPKPGGVAGENAKGRVSSRV